MTVSRSVADNAAITSPIETNIRDLEHVTILVRPDAIAGTDDTVTVSVDANGHAYQVDERTVTAVDGSDDYSLELPDAETVTVETANGETFTIDLVGVPR